MTHASRRMGPPKKDRKRKYTPEETRERHLERTRKLAPNNNRRKAERLKKWKAERDAITLPTNGGKRVRHKSLREK